VANLASQEQVVQYFVLGTLGSLLPDMDADNSAPVKITFSFLSIAMAFLVMFWLSSVYPSVLELVSIWFVTYLFFRWLIFAVFTRLTSHRGIFHSVPAALFFGFVAAAVSYRAFGFLPFEAWMSGLFVSFGYLVHLVLDELYSVDVFGLRTKRSFGTALKLYSKSCLLATLSMYGAMLAVFLITPTFVPVARVALDATTYQAISHRLVPEGHWF
jgi:LexA-binding, inner membrane-associated putative hydrolase